ncbi:MAG: hypothetical protein M0R77_00685 [Gammaproteobacteria bacterium]|nr:hypothetical protein [Acholeplasmataceae bacterium]MCK9529070.1 hypothetical protein [Gammaproteobacteria bacterium]
MSSIKPETLELSKIIDEASTISKDGAVEYNSDLYENLLKARGVELKDAKVVNSANVEIAVALAHSGGSKAIPVLAGNKDLERVTGKLNQGNAEIWFDTRREVTTRNPKTGETGVSYGATSMGVNLKGLKGGQAAAVKAELKELAAKKLGKK